MRSILLLAIAILAFSCSPKKAGFDAMGHFEADEFTVSAETSGRIIRLEFQEGERLFKGDTVALTDTVAVHLQMNQLDAQLAATRSKLPGILAQEKVVDAQISVLEDEKGRFSKLVSDKAVSEKSLDDIVHQITVARAQKNTFPTQVASLQREENVLAAQQALLQEQMSKCYVIAPSDGVIISLIAKPSDMMAPGKPILKLADVDRIILKAYVSEDQLTEIRIGDSVKVRVDSPDGGYLDYPGKVYWVSDQAEFTPKVIQTKKERVNLVYAVKVRVRNDGKIKIGMPGELLLDHE
jgi:HlyD family secretion protein